jgi:hypothetical protein
MGNSTWHIIRRNRATNRRPEQPAVGECRAVYSVPRGGEAVSYHRGRRLHDARRTMMAIGMTSRLMSQRNTRQRACDTQGAAR